MMDWGELADYVEFFVFIIEGHFTIEITAMADKIYVGFMQIIKTDKYINLFRENLRRWAFRVRSKDRSQRDCQSMKYR